MKEQIYYLCSLISFLVTALVLFVSFLMIFMLGFRELGYPSDLDQMIWMTFCAVAAIKLSGRNN